MGARAIRARRPGPHSWIAMNSRLFRDARKLALVCIASTRWLDAQQMTMPMTPARHDSVTRPTPIGMAPDPFGVSMDRMGSGTTWIPDAAALPSGRFMAGDWFLMLHGFVFAQENA